LPCCPARSASAILNDLLWLILRWSGGNHSTILMADDNMANHHEQIALSEWQIGCCRSVANQLEEIIQDG
jgi:hypothetical protein